MRIVARARQGAQNNRRGFALPTVMISSIVMFIVLLIGLQSISSVSVSINNQYINRIMQSAAESGNQMLEECISINGIDTIDTWWSNASATLRPGSGCGGATGSAEPSATQYVLQTADPSYRTSFSVSKPSMTNGVYSATVTAYANQLRRSNSVAINTQNVATQVKFNELKIKQMAVGERYVCAIMQNNKVYCWGADLLGRLGNTPSLDSLRPTEVYATWEDDGKTIESLSNAGQSNMCAVASGDAYCWGDNSKRMLGSTTVASTGEDSFSAKPVLVDKSTGLNGKTVTKIAVGANTVCALASGVVYCWGNDVWGSMADGTTTGGSVTPKSITPSGTTNSGITDISLTFNVGCFIKSSRVYCWGDNYYGAVGDGTVGKDDEVSNRLRHTPLMQNNPSSWRYSKVYASASRVCAIRTDAANAPLACWGIEVGNGDSNRMDPAPNDANAREWPSAQSVLKPSPMLASGYTYESMAVSRGRAQACVLERASTDKVFCWGSNEYGELGRGNANATFYNSPAQVQGLPSNAQISEISAGDNTTCALIDGDAYCWGRAYDGMKAGSNGVRTPTKITITTDHAIAGPESTCAINRHQSADTVICWGLNTSGQLGRGQGGVATWDRPGGNGTTLANVKTVSGTAMMDVGLGGGCAVNTSNVYACWGDQSGSGKNGNGSFMASGAINWTPAAVTNYSGRLTTTNVSNITSLDSGTRMNCAVTSGATRCAGGPSTSNPYTLPGNGTYNDDTTNDSDPTTYTYPSGADPQSFSVYVVAGHSSMGLNTGIRQVASGGAHACALKTNGQVHCWGSNAFGRIARPATETGTSTSTRLPLQVTAIGNNGKLLSTSDKTTCAATTAPTNRLYCWGYGLDGQLLTESDGYKNSYGAKLMNPEGTVLYGKEFIGLAVGEAHICVITKEPTPSTDNRVYCWGKNNKGQLGNGTNTSVVSLDPSAIQETRLVDPDTGLRMNPLKISSKGQTTCATTNYPTADADGYQHNLYCWGNNDYGQVGNREKQDDFTSTASPALLNAPLLSY